jgi:hypothetical protein
LHHTIALYIEVDYRLTTGAKKDISASFATEKLTQPATMQFTGHAYLHYACNEDFFWKY